jgi:hypothetical protein
METSIKPTPAIPARTSARSKLGVTVSAVLALRMESPKTSTPASKHHWADLNMFCNS